MRCWSLLSTLSEEGHDVTLICFGDLNECQSPAPGLSTLCREVCMIPVPKTQSKVGDSWGRLRGLFSSMPFGAQRLRCKLMLDTVKCALDAQPFDTVICDDVYMLSNLPARTKIPLLLNKHDITHEIMSRFLHFEKNPVKQLYGYLEQRKVRRLEVDGCRNSAVVLACSERDGEEIRKLCPNTRISIVPNVVDVRNYHPALEDDGRTSLFVGAMDWFPNRDAIEFFVNQIFPLIRRDAPAAEFIAAGRNPPRELIDRFSAVPGVKFTGTVPDMRPFLQQAGVCVVPLRIGSGTRLKILESAAAGKAIVSTRLGAEGLDFVDGQEILLADDPVSFAGCIVALLRDPCRRRAMGEAACRRVRQQYSCETLKVSLRRSLALLETPSHTARSLQVEF